MKNCIVVPNFNLSLSVITLYVRVRSFSFAKDVREKHKATKKESKKRSLRTELTRVSSTTIDGH